MNRFAQSSQLLVLLLLVALGVLPLRAQKWIAPTPEELSMTGQKGAPSADAVFLFHEEITDDDNLTFTYHNRIKILKPGGEDLARVVLNSVLPTNGNDDTIRSFAGRTIHSDGTVISMTQAPDQKVITGPNGKTIQKTFQLPEPEVGSILEYRYTIHLENHLEPPTWLLQRKYYVQRAHYEWLPTNERLAAHFKGEPTQAIQSIAYTPILPPGVQVTKGIAQDNTNRLLFELNAIDIPALPSEDLMPPVSSFGYRVRFYYLTASSNEEFWRQTGKILSDDWNRYIGSGDDIRRLVASLVTPSDTPEQKLRKLYAAVMQIDNLSVDRDRGFPKAEQQYPKSADEVLTMSRGNNDQITDLFVAMVRAAGMTAYVMRVSNRDQYIFDPSDPNIGQLDDNIAIVEVGGKELFLDPGTRFCPFGHLFWRHAATTGLRQTKAGTEIAETPPELVEAYQVQRVANLTIDGEGEATGTLKITCLGTAAIELRQAAAIDQLAVRKKLKEDWENVLPKGMEFEVSSIDKLEQFDEPLTIVATVKGPIGMTEGGRIHAAADLFEARRDQLFQPESRLEPVHFGVREIVRDAIRITFPASMRVVSLPASSTEKLNGVPLYEFSSESAATSVTIRRNYAIGQLIYPVSDYSELRSVFSRTQTKDREPIIFTDK
jgi:transglutaminase-like putative cysteine protease